MAPMNWKTLSVPADVYEQLSELARDSYRKVPDLLRYVLDRTRVVNGNVVFDKDQVAEPSPACESER